MVCVFLMSESLFDIVVISMKNLLMYSLISNSSPSLLFPLQISFCGDWLASITSNDRHGLLNLSALLSFTLEINTFHFISLCDRVRVLLSRLTGFPHMIIWENFHEVRLLTVVWYSKYWVSQLVTCCFHSVNSMGNWNCG